MKVHSLYIGMPEKVKDINTSFKRFEINEIKVYYDHIYGDQVENTNYHGGINRVLHQFPVENYGILESCFPNIKLDKEILGENIQSIGFYENSVCVGDVYQIGTVKCIVTEPRKPCWTIDYILNQKGVARFMQDNLLTGWFYRVVKEGVIKSGDRIHLVSRSYHDLSISSCVNALLVSPQEEVLKNMIKNPVLSRNWKESAAKVLKAGVIMDDSIRLRDS